MAVSDKKNQGKPNADIKPVQGNGRPNAPRGEASRSAARSGIVRPGERKAEARSAFSMTSIRSGLLHSLFMKIVLGLLIAIFAISIGSVGLGGFGGGGDSPIARKGASGPDPIAHVGDLDIPRAQLYNALAQQIQFNQQFGQPTGASSLLRMKQTALDSLTANAAQYQEAQRLGITASDAEIDKEIDKNIDDKIKSEQGPDEANYRRQIESQHGSMAAYRDELRKDYDRDLVKRKVMIDKLQKKVQDDNKVTEDDYKRSVTKLKLRQIVVRARPDLKAKDFKAAQTKAEGEAKIRAEKLAATLKNAPLATFIATAQKESEDPATKAKGGDLGTKLPSELPVGQDIKDALTAATGNLVGPLQDEYSKDYMIFYIEGRQLSLPKDYAKKKATYIKDYETQRDNDAWSKYQENLKKAAKVDVADPSLQAYKMQTEDIAAAPPAQQNDLRQQAVAKYQEALASAVPLEEAAIHYQLSQLYRDLNQPAKVVDELQAAVKGSENDNTPRLELATALHAQKRDKEALATLQEVSKSLDTTPAQPSMFGGNPNDAVRQQLFAQYQALGRKDLAMAEMKKITPPQAPPGGAMGAPGGIQGLNLNGGSQTITIPGAKGKPSQTIQLKPSGAKGGTQPTTSGKGKTAKP